MTWFSTPDDRLKDKRGSTRRFDLARPPALDPFPVECVSGKFRRLPRESFLAALAEEKWELAEETQSFLFAFTSGYLSLARTILNITGPYGLRELVNGRAVTSALGREMTSLWDRLGPARLQHAALCASTLHTVNPLSLAAALSAFRAAGGQHSENAVAEPEQLVLDLSKLGLLVPVEGLNGSQGRYSGGWRVPRAMAEGLKLYFPQGFEHRTYRTALLGALSGRLELLGEQMIQARRAGRWAYLVELVASRYDEVVRDFRQHTHFALDRLPRKVEQQAPLLKFIRLHVSYLLRVNGIHAAGAPGPDAMQGLSAVVAEMVIEARSLRADFISMLHNSNESAVTAGYAMFAYYAQGQFDDAIRLGEETQSRLDALGAGESQLTKQAADFFHFHRGVALGLSGDVYAAAEQFDVASAPGALPADSVPSQLATDYGALMSMFMSGDRTVHWDWSQVPGTTAGGYVKALRNLDLLNLDEAEQSMAPFEDTVPAASLWPLMTMIEHWTALLRGDDRWWTRRFADLYRKRPSHLRVEGLGRDTNVHMQCELLLSGGRLQQAKALLDKEGPSNSVNALVKGRIWLMAGEFDRAIQVADQYSYSVEFPLRLRADLKLIIAAALWADGEDRDRAESEFRAAADLCGLVGTVLPLAFLPRVYREAAVQVLEDHPFWELVAARDPQGAVSARELQQRVVEARTVFPTGGTVVDLTSRELEVLRLLRTNHSLQQIAERECRALSTVKKQAQAAYRKLGVNSREEAIQRAQQLGLFND